MWWNIVDCYVYQTGRYASVDSPAEAVIVCIQLVSDYYY